MPSIALRFLLLLATCFLSISCWPALASTKKEIPTPGGPLIIEYVSDQEPSREFNVFLSGQTILHSKEGDAPFPGFPEPKVIKYFGEPIGPFEAVAVFQQFSLGNACNGGPIWMLGISHDRSFTRSDPIDNCGGPAPEVTVNNGAIHVIFPETVRGSVAKECTYSGRELKPIC
jgi:hypothetical protein